MCISRENMAVLFSAKRLSRQMGERKVIIERTATNVSFENQKYSAGTMYNVYILLYIASCNQGICQ